VLAVIQKDQMNRMDVEGLRRGYYEELDVPRRQAELQVLEKHKPADWNDGHAKAHWLTEDFWYEKPNPSVHVFLRGSWVTHNRWGMRNRECDKVKAPGVVRIALLGSSHEYGYGVPDDQTFTVYLEDLLNGSAARNVRYEVLNFARPGYSTFQYLLELEDLVFDFNPDVVLLSINAWEVRRCEEQLGREIHWGHEIPFPWLRRVVEQAEVTKDMSEARIRAMLRPSMPDLVRQGWQRFATDCRDHGVPVHLVFRPFPFKWSSQDAAEQEQNKEQLKQLAEEIAVPFIDLSHAFDSVKYRYELTICPWDDHTNGRGQRLLAVDLVRALQDRDGNCTLRPRSASARPELHE
jgi:hypothetical protein